LWIRYIQGPGARITLPLDSEVREQMTKQVVTANRLRDGDVVYLAENGRWTPWLDEASVAETAAEAEAFMKIAEESEAACEVISIYGMPVEGERLEPVSTRERIRAKGPTTRTDLGKQAEPGFAKRA